MVSKRGEQVLAGILFFPFILGSTLLIYAEAHRLYNQITPSNPRPPRFIGYYSPPLRIDPVNLTQVLTKGNTPTITIHEETEVHPEESVRWRFYLGKRDACFRYDRTFNYTIYSYWHVNGHNTTLPIFWTKLKLYMNLTDKELQHEIENTHRESAIGKLYKKKPNWSLILEDLGEPVTVWNSWVGYERADYGNWTSSTLNTYCLIVETETEDSSVLVQLLIDGDSDIQLKIRCSDELVDPKSLFVKIFEHIEIPTSLLNSIELKKDWLYMT